MKNNEHQGHVFWRLMSYLKPYKWLTFFALLFLLLTTVIKSFVPLVASYFIDHFLTHFNQTAAFAGLLLALCFADDFTIFWQSSFCACFF